MTFPTTRWIWTEAVVPNSYIAARKSFSLGEFPHSATFAVFADTKYKLYINGRFVNAGPAPFRKPVVTVDRYEIVDFLQPGENTIAVVACFVGSDTKYNLAESPGIIGEIKLTAGDESQVLGTDESWEVARLNCWHYDTPPRNWAMEAIEVMDLADPAFGILAEIAPSDYESGPGGANASAWENPRVFDRPDLTLRSRLTPQLRWTSEDQFLPRQVFRGNTEIHLLQNAAVRLDHEHVWPELEENVYEMQRAGHVCFDRREGEHG